MILKSINNRKDLAKALNIELRKLTYVLYVKKVDYYYEVFEIPKKSGGSRKIKAPKSTLKYIQNRLKNIFRKDYFEIRDKNNIVNKYSHGFEKGKSIITNADIHTKKRYVLNVDIKDFFESFHFGRVRGYFIKNKYFKLDEKIATIIAQLTCYDNSLPQGAPTSPIITNMIFQAIDYKIVKLSRKYKLDYTRYADDLSFSTNDKHFETNWKEFLKCLEGILERSGFALNGKKTAFLKNDNRQYVTGLTVNKKVNVDKEYYRTTKAMAHNLYSKNMFYICGKLGTLKQLEGRFSFINQLNDVDVNFYKMSGKEREFSKFLFYKYFYMIDKPLIITEGKTDIKYIKAALKSLHRYYPELIENKGKEKFEYKVSFLRRKKFFADYLLFTQDGADTMCNIASYFDDKNKSGNVPKYYNYFSRFGFRPNYPVIMIFDHEISENKKHSKPLKKFIDKNGLKDRKAELENNLYLRIYKDRSLYIATNQLIDPKEECEIEDLFDDQTLNTVINGKTFSRKESGDQYYGKEIFSEYILNNYKKIDFSNFRNLLDVITDIIREYCRK